MQHAVDCWLKLTPEQQADAYEMHGLGCTGHSVNLTTDDSHSKSESKVLVLNMVRHVIHAQSTCLKAFDTLGGKRARAADVVKGKRKRGIGTDATEDEQVAEQLAKWDTTCFFNLSRDRRWAIIQSVREEYKSNAIEERALLKKMDEAKAARNEKARQDNIAKAANRALSFSKLLAIPVVACPVELASLVARLAGNPKELVKELCQQIRVRKNVYGTPPSALPCIGAKPNQTDEQEAQRLLLAFEIIVRKPLPATPRAPMPFPVRASTAAPTTHAVQLDIKHQLDISKAWGELCGVLTSSSSGLSFNTAKSKASRANSARAAGSSPTTSKAKVAPKPRATKTPTPAQRALEGEEFEEDGIDWKVLTVMWCAETEAIVVWYFDVVSAAEGELTESDMLEAIESGSSYECLEYSSVSEIRRWIQKGGS